MELLPWAAITAICGAILGLWQHASNTRKEVEDFKVKVAENYTTTPALDRAVGALTAAMNELKTELREFRREIHNDRRGAKGGN